MTISAPDSRLEERGIVSVESAHTVDLRVHGHSHELGGHGRRNSVDPREELVLLLGLEVARGESRGHAIPVRAHGATVRIPGAPLPREPCLKGSHAT